MSRFGIGAPSGKGRFLLLVLYILGCGAAQAQTYAVKQDVSEGILNMRDGPGTRHRLIVSIPAGSGGLSVGECRSPDDGTGHFKWCRASWSGRTGWISSCCIELENAGTSGREIASGSEAIRQEDMRRHGIAWNAVPKLPIDCPYQGEGWTVSFSREFYESYKARGFTLKAMCLALGSSDVRFDPETGRPLRCYSLAGWEDGGCFPFYVSDCFRTYDLISGNDTAEQKWRPAGCNIRYHPKTGKRVNSAFAITLFTGGEAGDAPDESSETRTSVSDAKLGSLLSGK